ncbi:MAG: hypothetical protein DLM67_15415 [Candidatus Nephthysia bennettiae]|uniref:Integrase catalytic domain-containing protein n=1 Tax=Candidatus Nephthysia bennettiae TaxID=3127016 RepID=A0A934JY40_9BACT|nr:hypothetical protein [Candidatus Dormibacteraeota bacterium]PZR91987.1 MAG: hypothetical protein DLM67_15415 [Candidatus Dormibacteraeota bacterium]
MHRRGPWRPLDQLRVATAEWIEWWNHRRPSSLHRRLTHGRL